LALGLYYLGGLAFLGLPFLNLWQPGDQHDEYELLMILTIGEIIPLSQWVTYSAIIGIGKHRRLALLSLCEGLCVLVFSFFSIAYFGLVGAAVAVATSGFLFRGVLQWSYGCQLVQVTRREYAQRVFLPILLTAAIPVSTLGAFGLAHRPLTWLEFCVTGLLYTVVYWLILLIRLLGWQDFSLVARVVPSVVRKSFHTLRRSPQLAHLVMRGRDRRPATGPSNSDKRR
jgi:O-antigen/teichoic acid export membrane protein